MKKKRRKRRRLSDAHIDRIAETIAIASRMAEQGLRPMPLEIKDMFEYTFTGETWETSWHFADHLLLLSINNEMQGTQARFDILVDDPDFATTLIDIPIIAHLELQVTLLDTLPRDDVRYADLPKDTPLWRIHTPDFQEYPDDIYIMLFVSTKKETDDGEQDNLEK